MTREQLNPAQEVELARLIAEQEADDSDRVRQRDLSLDVPVTERGDMNFLDVVVDGEQAMAVSGLHGNRVTPEQRKEWRWLRSKKGWTYQQIAEYAGVNWKTVRKHLPRKGNLCTRSNHQKLLALKDEIREAYEAGATLMEVAQVFYRKCGYKSPAGCRQQIRLVLLREGVQLRPRSFKHGACMQSAAPEVRRAYINQRARIRRRPKLKSCTATTKTGRPCGRWALPDEILCWNHLQSGLRKWTRDAMVFAIRRWTSEHERPPRTTDWLRASSSHPALKTVYDEFGSWGQALWAANVIVPIREREQGELRRAA